MKIKKKLIEVALPLEAINKASAREKSIRHGHPSTLHLWWARRPLAAARAVIFAQMVDDPSANPDLFPTAKAQEKERQRLFKIIEQLVQWENTTNEKVLEQAREEIWQSWRRACAENADHPQAKELFDRKKLPAFHDPFAGGGTLPLEAQRLGLEAHASDLNPVAVLINKAMIEIPPKFAGMPPVNPEARKGLGHSGSWKGAKGLAEDVRYYAIWIREEARRRIGHLYPEIEVTPERAKGRSDLKAFVGKRLNVVAWIWARTVRSPNPAYSEVHVPLSTSFVLSTKSGKEAYVEPIFEKNGYRFSVKTGKPTAAAKSGTRAGKAQDFLCLMSGTPIERTYIRDEGKAGRLGSRLIAVVAEGGRGRVYLTPAEADEALAKCSAQKALVAETRATFLAGRTPTRAMITGGVCSAYGLSTWGHLFTDRQLVALTTFCDLLQEVRQVVVTDAGAAKSDRVEGAPDTFAATYAEAISTYLGMGISRLADAQNSLCQWGPGADQTQHLFRRQALPMVWDYAESSVFSGAAGDLGTTLQTMCRVLEQLGEGPIGVSLQGDAQSQSLSAGKVVSTDPPYYDNIGYADLSDFFYAWLRRALKPIQPSLFATLEAPKADELVATVFRHGTKEKADAFFMAGMSKAMKRLAEQAHPTFPVSVYYAFKQSESGDEGEIGSASTGWDSFLEAIIAAGFSINGTWPMRTERASRSVSIGTNALASSIVLVCRKRESEACTATRREFVAALKSELPHALAHLQRGNIAPVDLAQAAIGPGMAIFTRYARVLDAEGKSLSVREALFLINQTLDEALTQQEGDFDADSRWALAWFDQQGFAEGEYGVAETLSTAKNTSVSGLVEAGILSSSRGKVRLLKPNELPPDWDPETDKRLTVWETVHHLIRALEAGGEPAAASLVAKLGTKAEVTRELAYRLYTLCERKKRATEALAYNGIVQSWPEIVRLAKESTKPAQREQADLFASKGGK